MMSGQSVDFRPCLLQLKTFRKTLDGYLAIPLWYSIMKLFNPYIKFMD